MGFVTISLKDGCYFLDGPGEPVEYAVKMRQLPQQSTMVQLLRRGELDRETTGQLALKFAQFYDQVSTEELYAICGEEIEDVLQIAYCLRDWMAGHPEMVDQTL